MSFAVAISPAGNRTSRAKPNCTHPKIRLLFFNELQHRTSASIQNSVRAVCEMQHLLL